MEKTDPEDIRAYLRAVGSHLHRSAKICIGGSAALLLTGYLSRYTEYINVVDEVPEEIRQAHTTQRWQQELPLKENAQRNWYILFGEENLPQ